MRPYIAHLSRERIRLRHPVFATNETKVTAMEILKDLKGIAGIKPGHSSILLFKEPETELDEICGKLEKAFPELLKNNPARREPETANAERTPKARGGMPARHIELEALLTSGLTTVALALTGFHHLHALAGGVFTLLATGHVWTRRKRL